MDRKRKLSSSDASDSETTIAIGETSLKGENEETADNLNDLIAERCNFHLYQTAQVHAMAYSKFTKRLCVLRRVENDRSINKTQQQQALNVLTFVEFYNAGGSPLVFLEKSIPLFDSLGTVVWCDSWVIAAGLSGKLCLFSPFTTRFRRIQLCPSEIVAMTRSGSNIFVVNKSAQLMLLSKNNAENSELLEKEGNSKDRRMPTFIHKKLLDFPTDRHIVSLASSKASQPPQKETRIAVGMTNLLALLCLNFEQNGEVKIVSQRDIELPHSKKYATLPWSLLFFDYYLFAGDSLGRLTIYNSLNGIVYKIFQSHQTHITALASDNYVVFASGVDYRIQIFSLSGNKKVKQTAWQICGHRALHSNDVRALCSLNKMWLVSGGFEGLLISNRHSHCRPQKRPECAFSIARGLLLTRQLTTIEIWYKPNQLQYLNLSSSNSRYMKCRLDPKRLLRIESGHMGFIKQASISPNGKYICYSGNVKGAVSVLELHENFVEELMKNVSHCQKKCDSESSPEKRQKEEVEMEKIAIPTEELIKEIWSNQTQSGESAEEIRGGRTVSAMHCTDNCLYYASGEYQLHRLDLANKTLSTLFQEDNFGQITKICVNPSETALLALTTEKSAVFVPLNKSSVAIHKNVGESENVSNENEDGSMNVATNIPKNGQKNGVQKIKIAQKVEKASAFECVFVDDERVVLLTNNRKEHLIVLNVSSQKCEFLRSATELGCCESEWLANLSYSRANSCLLSTTNKGRVCVIKFVKQNEEAKLDIYAMQFSDNQRALSKRADLRIEPFWGGDGGDENVRQKHIVLVGHQELKPTRAHQKAMPLRSFKKN